MLSYFHHDRMKVNRNIPPVVITEFRIFNKPVSVKRKDGKIQPIHLKYSDNMISFDFAALNFTNPGKNNYAYKLEGFDHEWMHSGNQHTATYTNLDGGQYIFKVIAANNDGYWSSEGASVNITVEPPFWKTWWFYTAAACLVALFLYFIYRLRIKQIMKLQGIRQRISRDLHDDIGSTLSSINMMSAMANKGSDERKKELFKSIR